MKPWTQAEVDFLAAHPTMRAAEVAVILGRSYRGVLRKRERFNKVGHRPVGAPKGELHGRVKLTEAQVREMRRIYAAGGSSYLKLAVQFDLEATSTVEAIIKRRTWRHVA